MLTFGMPTDEDRLFYSSSAAADQEIPIESDTFSAFLATLRNNRNERRHLIPLIAP